jgi:hypothetical protein
MLILSKWAMKCCGINLDPSVLLGLFPKITVCIYNIDARTISDVDPDLDLKSFV